MASVRQRSPGRWEIRVFVGRDPLTRKKLYEQQTIAAKGKRAAELEANRWELDLRDGELTGDGGTFGQLADRVLDLADAKNTMSPSTLTSTRGVVDRYLRRPLGDVDVPSIRTRTLDELYAELVQRGGRCQRRPCPRTACPEGRSRCQRKTCTHPPCEAHEGACADWVPCEATPCQHGGPLAVSTVVRVHVVVHAMLEQARRWGWVRRNYADDAQPGEVHEEEIDPPGEEDVILLLAELDRVVGADGELDPRLADYVAVSIDTGARRGANHATRWTYISDDYTAIRFPRVIAVKKGHGRGVRRPEETLVDRAASKNKRGAKQVTLSPYTSARLRALHIRAKERALAAGTTLPDDAYVWTDDPLGTIPWHPNSTSRKFRAARGGAGLDETRLHDLRHAMATILIAAGVDPKVVGQRGGWAKVATMLNRYAHATPAADRRAAAVMDGVFDPPADTGT